MGEVYKGYSLNDAREEVAIQIIQKDHFRDQLDFFTRELMTLKKIKGKHVLEYKDILQTQSRFYIITKLWDGGNLNVKLREKGGKLPEFEALTILLQITEVFVELENMGLEDSTGKEFELFHGYMTPNSILFDNGKACISDLGLYELVDYIRMIREKERPSIILESPYWKSPQILMDEAYTSKCDIWSLGIIFYGMLHGTVPYKASTAYSMVQLISKGLPKISEELSEETRDLISKMLKSSEEERISRKEILAHPAISKIGLSAED